METNLGNLTAAQMLDKLDEKCAECMKKGLGRMSPEWTQFSVSFNRQLNTLMSNPEEGFDARMAMSYWTVLSQMLSTRSQRRVRELSEEAKTIREVIESGDFRSLPKRFARKARGKLKGIGVTSGLPRKQRDGTKGEG